MDVRQNSNTPPLQCRRSLPPAAKRAAGHGGDVVSAGEQNFAVLKLAAEDAQLVFHELEQRGGPDGALAAHEHDAERCVGEQSADVGEQGRQSAFEIEAVLGLA